MSKIISDLHIHSINSDGNKSFDEIINLSNDLLCISITDHDTINDIKLKKINNTYVIPGVEITCLFEGYKLDLLCYSVDIKLNDRIQAILKTIYTRKNNWADDVIYNINNNTYFSKISDGESISKFQIRPKYIKGFIYKKQIIDYIAQKYNIDKILLLNGLKDCFPCDSYFFYPNYSELIPNLLESNFIVSLAHPKRYKINDNLYFQYMLKKLLDVGLNCIEVYHPSADINDFRYLKHLAKEYNLTITGGSDHHNETSMPIGSLGLESLDIHNFFNLLKI